MAGVLPSPLKLPPVRVTEAPLKLAVGSDLTVTAPIARPAVRISAPITAALMPNFRAMGTNSFHRRKPARLRPREVLGPVALGDRLDPGSGSKFRPSP